ncbi:CDP-glycerol glycerophosphotransferase [Luteimonas marina]|uniref:CDP-glycerol glycerophosphotransferase n=1 Tax=Luteimonas marina TaxID=488485 RepID=A0A5C5TX07_9GAMM|nr:CDP-glycerol glycerophosphotransferase family protein [Luteimonas marina]TWT18109.1 CDP-glycerol glycerophosphotransferase [Luteimonas marina]
MSDILLAARERYALPIIEPLVEALLAAGHDVHGWFDGPLAAAGCALPAPASMWDTRGAVALRPDAVLCAMDWIPPFFGGAKVQLFHGFNTSKHSDRRGHFRIRGLFDLYCTQGPATTAPFRALADRMGHFKVVETGWSKLDPLFRDDGGASARMRERAEGRPVAMFASTFTERVSAAPHLHEAIRADIERGERYWLLTLHPKCDSSLFDRYRALAGANAAFVEPEQIVVAQRAADVLVSDTTSVVPEFSVQRKPVVTFRHRRPEPWMIDFDDSAQLPDMLRAALSPTAERLAAIHAHADDIHPWRDGRSSARVVQAVEDLVAGRLGSLAPKPFTTRLRGLQLRQRLGYWGPAA